jgi:hypothetical protein
MPVLLVAAEAAIAWLFLQPLLSLFAFVVSTMGTGVLFLGIVAFAVGAAGAKKDDGADRRNKQ